MTLCLHSEGGVSSTNQRPPVSRMFARRRKPTYWHYSVNCSGSEAHLSGCRLGQLTPQANASCAGGQPAVVSCVAGRAFAPSAMTGFRKAFRQEVSEGAGPGAVR